MRTIGIDAGQTELFVSDLESRTRVRNVKGALQEWAASLEQGCAAGVEATGRYHRPVLQALHEAGVRTYLLNPMHVSRYIRIFKPTLKTDSSDADMISRYLAHGMDLLVPYKMPDKDLQELKDLLSFRETLVEKRTALKQSLSEQDFRLKSFSKLDEGFRQALKEVEDRIRDIAQKRPLYARLLKVDGIGRLGAAALTWVLEAHDFRSSDQAVSYLGLDVGVRQSGKFFGKCKLTKRGPSFVRTFLFNGANSLRRLKELEPLFKHHAKKGLSPTAANLAVARKLVRVAYSHRRSPEAFFERKNLLPQLKNTDREACKKP